MMFVDVLGSLFGFAMPKYVDSQRLVPFCFVAVRLEAVLCALSEFTTPVRWTIVTRFDFGFWFLILARANRIRPRAR